LKPKQRIYIDARNEKLNHENARQVCYIINGASDDHIKQKIYECIGLNTLRIEVVPASEKVIITYYEYLITPTYMDYKFQLKGIEFKREGG